MHVGLSLISFVAIFHHFLLRYIIRGADGNINNKLELVFRKKLRLTAKSLKFKTKLNYN